VDSKQAMRRTAELRRVQSGRTSDLSGPLAPLLACSKRIASYVGKGTEPCVPPRPGWLLPVLLPGGDLDWAVADGRYEPNRFGIPEPVGPRLGPEAIGACDLVLVPALLVDRRGTRLGRGGGSYDRALARATGLTVALLHDDELVDELPCEPHDIPVAAVATPSLGVVRLPGQ
jgi:5-formyltetrahydrofolate cyclo-ligase